MATRCIPLIAMILSTFFLNQSLHAQAGIKTQKDQEKIFVDKSFKKSPELSGDAELRKTYEEYQEKQSDKNFRKYEKRATEVSLAKDIKVVITISTRIPGATVKYKPLDGTDPFTASQPTNNCKIKLPLGYCIIWTERNGRKTANDLKILVEDDEVILIEEIQ